MEEGTKSLKCVLVGDDGIGKTCFVISNINNSFPEDYVPNVFENCTTTAKYINETLNIELCDTSGKNDYRKLRPLSYQNTDFFLLCFSIDSKDSLENAINTWLPEIKVYYPKPLILLVGLKSDLREPIISSETSPYVNDFDIIQPSKCRDTACQIGAFAYLECSSLKQYNIKEVLQKGIEAVRQGKKKKIAASTQPETVHHRRKRFCLLL